MASVDLSFKVSDSAQEVVNEAKSQEESSEELALWIEVVGTRGDSYTYDVYFQEAKHAGFDDLVLSEGETQVVIPSGSIDALLGATLDVDAEGGLVIMNPNSPAPTHVPNLDFGPEALSNELAQKVINVLADEINPSIAAHGGRADLIGVVDSVAYVVLGGGCQGCGLANVTLSQGIAVAIKESIPEIQDVVDVTDHASGSNPFYSSSKK